MNLDSVFLLGNTDSGRICRTAYPAFSIKTEILRFFFELFVERFSSFVKMSGLF